jgi:hypothetical protein
MIRGIARSLAAAALVIVVLFAARAVDFVAFCEKHHVWTRREAGRPGPILSESRVIARPGEAIFACTSQHCFAATPACHVDLGCYCAPATLAADSVARFLDHGNCTLDQPFPSKNDISGACQHAACDDHFQ